jgi:hypothetical protein
MQFLNSLTPLQWAAATAVPFAVVALYFLKLRRQPITVPSTFLWQKSVEDLHVNSLFQRLRRNLLLFLQLLILALALLALARPAWFAWETGGQRHVIVIDNSASMAATDVAPTRLEWAKEQARTQVIDKMSGDDTAMIISFNDSATVVRSYTTNRQLLRERIGSIEPTQRTTNLREALEVASGLANPQKYREGVQDINPPLLHMFTDGGFTDVKEFALAALEPRFYVAGKSDANVAIAAMMVRRAEDRPEQLQVFARLHNYSAEPVAARSELYLDGDLKDAKDLRLDAKTEQAVVFDLDNLDEGVLELRLDARDMLRTDNVARCVVGNVRRAKVLVVSRGNHWLELALETEAAGQITELQKILPDELDKDDYQRKAATGQYDLVIYDGCAPATMPQTNTLFIGAIPRLPELGEVKTLTNPIIAEVNDAHPLFRFVNMDDVGILESLLPQLPAGADVLLESEQGPLAFLLTREGFWDCVIGFGFERQGEKGREYNTTWVRKASFPLFMFNALRVLGNVQDAITDEIILPGHTVGLRSDSLKKELQVRDPTGKTHAVRRTPQGRFLFNQTDRLGVYEFGDGAKAERRFAVNLFDPRESDIAPRRDFDIGHTQVAARELVNRSRLEGWRWLTLAVLAVLLVEWYVYNRRVYI